MTDVAIAHDQIVARGGAEHVAFEMARALDAPIYAAAVDQDIVPDDVDVHCIVNTKIGNWCMDSHYLLQDIYQMQRWQCVRELHEYDCVLLNKTNPAWYVPKDTQATAWYVHSTPRGQYDQFHVHGRSAISRLLKTPMRPLYRPNVAYADEFACNSELVQRRMERYWDVPPEESEVIHPPVHVADYGPEHATRDADYYLTFGRLHGHKRTHDIVEAFKGLDMPLIVGGDGPDAQMLKEMAGTNVRFVGYMNEDEKRRRLAECKAFVFAAENEDFGLTPIEALASGTPVIGVDDGFTTHQILDGQNGILFERGRLQRAIKRFERNGVAWSAADMQAFAQQFNAGRFRESIRALVERAIDAADVTPELAMPDERQEVATAITDGAGVTTQHATAAQNQTVLSDKLNLGSGEDYRDGWLNVDINARYDPDVEHDLNQAWPGEWDQEFDEVLAAHVVEHLDDPQHFFEEAARVLRDGGTLTLKVPLGINALTDISHTTLWTYDTPLQFAQNWEDFTEDYQFDPGVPFELERRDVEMVQHDPLKPLAPLLNRWVETRPGVWTSGWPCSSGEVTAVYRRVPRDS